MSGFLPEECQKRKIMLDKLEKKIGRFAIKNLTNYLIIGYVIGYLLYFGATYTNLNILNYLSLEPYYIIHNFQIWRVISWVLMPPRQNIIFAIIMIIFYWQLGTTLEKTIGTFKYNCFIFGGILFSVLGAFLLYGILFSVTGSPVVGIGAFFSTYYINMSIFLAFAVCYPDMQIMLYFIIPIRMKWLALVYAVLILIEFFQNSWPGKVAIIASLLNFGVFFLATRDWKKISPSEMKRKNEWKKRVEGTRSSYSQSPPKGQANTGRFSVHKCEICGRTETTNPELAFRFCSKCKGNHEFCSDHIFTHKHII